MDPKKVRIVFMGTGSLSAQVLQDLIADGYHIVGVVAQPDRPVGRKKELVKVACRQVAERYGIPLAQPVRIREDYAFLEAMKPELILTLAYGQIVPREVLSLPLYGALNLHGSILPKYRGAAPIQYALINGEKETGMTLMEMIPQMDAGRMYATKTIAIEEQDNTTSLFAKMAPLATALVRESLGEYLAGTLQGIPQKEELVTFAPSIKKEQEHLPLDLPCLKVLGWIRALAETPGGYVVVNGQKWKLLAARPVEKEQGKPRTLFSPDRKHLYLQLHDGTLEILSLQKEGKKRMDAQSFLQGVGEHFVVEVS